MKHSYWRSIYTNITYEMPEDWAPSWGGWEFLGIA